MRVLALYRERTFSLMRRVIAPFSVLAERGHSFFCMQIPLFDAGYAASYDATILPNWILTDEEIVSLERMAMQQHTFVYDLSDPDLLQQEAVCRTIRFCRLVTVPNKHLAMEVKIAVPGTQVMVLPSCLDLPYLMLGNRVPRPEYPVIACVGPFDWEMIGPALHQVTEQHPQIRVLADEQASACLQQHIATRFFEPGALFTLEEYPVWVRRASLLLLPIERYRGQDMIWVHEFGILCRPTLVLTSQRLNQTSEHKTATWVQAITTMLTDRAKKGQEAFIEASKMRSTKLADQYLTSYRQKLPALH